MNSTSSISIRTDLYPLYDEKVRKVQKAIHAAAEHGYFSLLDVYRELGFCPSKSPKWNNKEREFEPSLIHKTMKSMGIQSIPSKQRRARTRRYFIAVVGFTNSRGGLV